MNRKLSEMAARSIPPRGTVLKVHANCITVENFLPTHDRRDINDKAGLT